MDDGEGNPRLRTFQEVDVALEDPRVERGLADHVVGHEEELPSRHPLVVLVDDARQLGDRAGLEVAREDQVEHGHEVAFARTEAAVEVAAVARPGGEAVADHAEGEVERLGELFGDDVVAERALGVEHAVGEFEYEPVRRERIGDVDQFAEEGHGDREGTGAELGRKPLILRQTPPCRGGRTPADGAGRSGRDRAGRRGRREPVRRVFTAGPSHAGSAVAGDGEQGRSRARGCQPYTFFSRRGLS